MFTRLLICLCFVAVVTAFRPGIGGRFAVYDPLSYSTRESKLLKREWGCDPFTKCRVQKEFFCFLNASCATTIEFNCMLEQCPYNKTKADDCPNRIVGQYSSMCLQVGHNDLRRQIFLGKSYSLVLEPNVVANCSSYALNSEFVTACDLYRLEKHDIDYSMVVRMSSLWSNYRKITYHRTNYIVLNKAMEQFRLMQKQIAYNGLQIAFEPNDFRRVDFPIRPPTMTHQLKVSTPSGFTFTLPFSVTEKYTLPVYAERYGMDIRVHDDCYYIVEWDATVKIVKKWACRITHFFSF
jgi:hypothetical protein